MWINEPCGIRSTFGPHNETNALHEHNRASRRSAARGRAALCRAQEGLSAERLRDLPPHQMGPDDVLPRRLLPAALRALEPGPRCAEPGGAGRSSQQPLLLL